MWGHVIPVDEWLDQRAALAMSVRTNVVEFLRDKELVSMGPGGEPTFGKGHRPLVWWGKFCAGQLNPSGHLFICPISCQLGCEVGAKNPFWPPPWGYKRAVTVITPANHA